MFFGAMRYKFIGHNWQGTKKETELQRILAALSLDVGRMPIFSSYEISAWRRLCFSWIRTNLW